jgi:hypothetical protein
MGFSNVYSTTFNNFDILPFDNFNLSIAIFIMHDKISDVDIVHMQGIRTHFFVIGIDFAIATNFIEVEVMQLAIIQV